MFRSTGFGFLSLVVLLFGKTVAAEPEAAPLRLATFQAEATLPLGQLLYLEPLKTVEHPLLAKGVVLEDGSRRYVLCAVDWCTMGTVTRRTFREKIAAAAETDVSRVMVQCVHQHTAPPFDVSVEALIKDPADLPKRRDLTFLDQVTDRLAAAVREAAERLEPFDRVGTGEAKVERVAAIRRVFTEDGKLLTRWSSCTDPALRAMPEGPIDPMLKTITLARGNKPLVRLHYYAVHPQSYYRDGRASYDYPGIARQRLEEKEGVFQIYFTGCAGDVTAGKYNDGTPNARAELADRLFAGMQASVAATRWSPVSEIEWRAVPVLLDPRTDGGHDPAKNRTTMNDARSDPEVRRQAAGRLLQFERLGGPMELASIELGPATIVHLPGEPMVEFQKYAQRIAPQKFVAVAGYGLGTPGYICTEAAFEEGGYEPGASAVVPESEKRMKTAIRQMLGVESAGREE
jgi:hypothetical protein